LQLFVLKNVWIRQLLSAACPDDASKNAERGCIKQLHDHVGVCYNGQANSRINKNKMYICFYN